MIDLISSLPTTVVSHVLNSWLEPKAVARLDSAYCNDQRSVLSEIICLLKYPGASERSLKWLNLRQIPVEDLVLSDSVDINMFRQYARRFGDRIRVIQLDKADYLRADILMCITLFCKNLTAFVCENSTFDNAMSNLLFACPDLQEIRLGKFNVLPIIGKPKRAAPRAGECDQLRSISVSEFSFLESLLQERPGAALSTLRLNLNSCSGLTSSGVPVILKFKSLTSLSLYACTLDDHDVIKIINVCPHIVHLDLSISNLVTDVCVTHAVQYLDNLRTLNIELTSITDAALVAVSRHRCEHLVALYFADCAAVTAVGVNAILQSCVKLRTMSMATYQSEAFDVPGNRQILANLHTLTIEGRHEADAMLESIAKYCKQLRRLRLVCLVSNVYEDRGLLALALHCETLTTLVLVGENALHVGRLALALWEKQRPHLTITYDRNVLTYHILDRMECI